VQTSAPQAATLYAFVEQPLLGEGLSRALESCPGLNFLGYSADPHNVTEQVVRLRPDLFMVDQSFGLRTLFQVLADLRRAAVETRVILWTRELSPADQRMARQGGIFAFLERNRPVSSLLDCFRAAAAGRIWSPDSGAASGHQDQHLAMRLTQREREAMALLKCGLKNREIAASMRITPGTVKVHLMHIFEKTGVRDRHELSLLADRLLEEAAQVEARAAPRKQAGRSAPVAGSQAAGGGMSGSGRP